MFFVDKEEISVKIGVVVMVIVLMVFVIVNMVMEVKIVANKAQTVGEVILTQTIGMIKLALV